MVKAIKSVIYSIHASRPDVYYTIRSFLRAQTRVLFLNLCSGILFRRLPTPFAHTFALQSNNYKRIKMVQRFRFRVCVRQNHLPINRRSFILFTLPLHCCFVSRYRTNQYVHFDGCLKTYYAGSKQTKKLNTECFSTCLEFHNH